MQTNGHTGYKDGFLYHQQIRKSKKIEVEVATIRSEGNELLVDREKWF